MCCVRSETSDNRCFQSVGPSAGWEDHRGLGGALSFASCFLTLPLCVLPGLYLGCDCHITSRAQEYSEVSTNGRTVRKSKRAGRPGWCFHVASSAPRLPPAEPC